MNIFNVSPDHDVSVRGPGPILNLVVKVIVQNVHRQKLQVKAQTDCYQVITMCCYATGEQYLLEKINMDAPIIQL